MKTFKFSIFLLLVLFSCCNSPQNLVFYGKTIMVDYPTQITSLKGRPVILEDIYTGMMFAYDGLLVFHWNTLPDGRLYLFDAETGVRINAVGQIGQGPDDFINPHFLGDFEKYSNEIYLWVNDISRNVIVKLNMRGERVKEINTAQFRSTNWYGVGRFNVLNDSLLLAEISPVMIFENKFTASGEHVFDYRIGKTVKSHMAYSEFYEPNAVGLFPGIGAYLTGAREIKPNRTKLATVKYFLKRVDILDIQTGKWKSITTKHTPDLNYILSNKPIRMYYRSLQIDDHYIFVDRGTWETPAGLIYVFDWDGNFKHILRIDKNYVVFAFDPVRKKLYTKTDCEQITAYDLNFLYQ